MNLHGTIQHTMLEDLGHYWEKRDGAVMGCGLLHPFCGQVFRAEKRSTQASANPLSQAQGGLFCVLTACVDCVRQFVCLSLREF